MSFKCNFVNINVRTTAGKLYMKLGLEANGYIQFLHQISAYLVV